MTERSRKASKQKVRIIRERELVGKKWLGTNSLPKLTRRHSRYVVHFCFGIGFEIGFNLLFEPKCLKLKTKSEEADQALALIHMGLMWTNTITVEKS